MTIKQEHSVLIDRPVEEVFAFVTDPNNDPLWHASTLDTEQTSEGSVGVGTTYRIVLKFLGRRIETTYEIIEYEPPRKHCVRITSGPIPAVGCLLLEPTNDASIRFTQNLDRGELGFFFRMAEPLVRRAINRQSETDLATLRDLLESSETDGM
jgi:Polyketide cyclase / dehydrase and lipid transport